MKIALGVAAITLLACVPAGAQTIGGTLAAPVIAPSLSWTPPASPKAVEVSGTDATFLPSTFVSFDKAVAVGNVDLKEGSKTVADAAAASRKAANSTPSIRVVQDNHGRLVVKKS